MKLVPAKCPNCGAELELDDNLKRTKCEYCKTTIIFDEAIQKYQIELNGKIKTTRDYSDRIETAEKYIKLKKYDNAKRVIREVFEKDELNLEAKKVFIKLLAIDIDELIIENEDILVSPYLYTIRDNMLIELNELDVLDEESKFKDFINEIKSKYKDLFSQMDEAIRNRDTLLDKCNTYCNYKYDKLIKLLKALGYDEKEYGKQYGIKPEICARDDGWIRDEHYPFRPKIINISINNIYIFHDSSVNSYERKRDYKGNTKYTFTKQEKMSFNEQINIVDKLLEEPDKSSFLSKLFGK